MRSASTSSVGVAARQRFTMKWRSPSATRRFYEVFGVGPLSWAGWLSSYRLMGRLEDAGTRWNVRTTAPKGRNSSLLPGG